MEKIDPAAKTKSAIFLAPETLERILRVCNYVEGLKVQLTDSDSPNLVFGELASILEIPRRGTGGGTVVDEDTPYEPKDKSTPEVKKVGVIFGSVNNIVPSILDATTEVLTPLDGMTGTPPRPPELATPYTGVGYLETVWSGSEPKELESAEVKFGTEVPEKDDTHGYHFLFSVVIAEDGGMSLYKGVTQSLEVERFLCGANLQYYWGGV